MKSDELYRELRGSLGAWFRGEGFKRAPRTQLGWYRAPLLVWFQCNRWGWDPYAGSSFFINFQAGASPEPWAGPTERLQAFLTTDELETVRALQNAVIAKLSPPPAAHIAPLRSAFSRSSPNPDALVDALLAEFKPVDQPYRKTQDFGLRYFDAQDARIWCSFLVPLFPRLVTSAARGGAA